jgi:hypothetical protein
MKLMPRTLIAWSLLAAAPAGFALDTQTPTVARNPAVFDQHFDRPGSHLAGGDQADFRRVEPEGLNRDQGWPVARPSAAPEIDPASAAAGCVLLLGGLCLLRSRRREA